MPTNRDNAQWTRNHPLEGDGLLVNFYNYMWKKNKNYESCPEVLIPDTVVYEHNFPRGWYTYERAGRGQKGEIKKKQGKELDTSSIGATFYKQPDPAIDIVASYIYASDDPDTGEEQTCVEFFDHDGLHGFLNHRKDKKEGILQKFLLPKGPNNSLIQVVWSPRVCILQRKTNRHALNDKNYAPYARAVTYEGDAHYCADGICAPRTTARIKTVCNSICIHFNSTEHSKVITRMVLYFKVDRGDNVWLLWCGSVRVADRHAPSAMSVNMSPIFSSPDAHPPQMVRGQAGDETAEDVLERIDRDQLELGHDHVHFRACCTSPDARSPGRSRAAPQQPGARRRGDEDAAYAGGACGADDAAADGRLRRRLTALKENWMKSTPLVEREYKQLQEGREQVQSLLGDVFYEAYSHFQIDSHPFIFSPSHMSILDQIETLLGEESFAAFLKAARLERVPQEDLEKISGGRETFWIQKCALDRVAAPISKLSGEASTWVNRYFDRQEDDLRERAMPLAEQAMMGQASPREEDEGDTGFKPGGLKVQWFRLLQWLRIVPVDAQHFPRLWKSSSSSVARYEIHLDGPLLPLVVEGVVGIGRISPLQPVTLAGPDRERAGVPETAQQFCWAYPLEDVGRMRSSAVRRLLEPSPACTFVTAGGFVYVDADGEVCGANAVAGDNCAAASGSAGVASIEFDGPFTFPPDYVPALDIGPDPARPARRLVPETSESRRGCGVRYLAWLTPGEELTGGPGSAAWEDWPHGAFVFLYRDPRDAAHPMDAYYRVLGKECAPAGSRTPQPIAPLLPAAAGGGPRAAMQLQDRRRGSVRRGVGATQLEKSLGPGQTRRISEGPMTIGPFDILNASSLKLEMVRGCRPSCDRYRVELGSTSALSSLAGHGVMGLGRISPLWPITLQKGDRKAAQIPKAAESYCWAFPLEDLGRLPSGAVRQMTPERERADAGWAFINNGGFIYVDETGDVCGVNAIDDRPGGKGLRFQGPLVWDNSLTTLIHKGADGEPTGRWQPCTNEALQDLGVRFYCYLHPDEQLGDAEPQWMHGAFVYLLHDPADRPSPLLRDTFFRVVCSKSGCRQCGDAQKGPKSPT